MNLLWSCDNWLYLLRLNITFKIEVARFWEQTVKQEVAQIDFLVDHRFLMDSCLVLDSHDIIKNASLVLFCNHWYFVAAGFSLFQHENHQSAMRVICFPLVFSFVVLLATESLGSSEKFDDGLMDGRRTFFECHKPGKPFFSCVSHYRVIHK